MSERLAEIVGAAIGLAIAFAWIAWKFRALTAPAFMAGLVLGLAFGLSGCKAYQPDPPKWSAIRFDKDWRQQEVR